MLSAMLKIMHPELYHAGREAMQALAGVTKTPEVLVQWASVFNAVQIIANRETPLHRDSKSRAPWYDLLASIGSYSNCIMEFPGIGVSINYLPGTVVAFSGKVLRHGVGACTGERICYAYFMRDSVHRSLTVKAPHWMECSHYAAWDGRQVPWMKRVWRPM